MASVWYCLQVSLRIICMVICSRLLYNKFTKRKSIEIYGETRLNQYEHIAISMLIIGLTTSSMTIIQPICTYIATFNSFNWQTAKIFVTLYEIRRLQYCFGAEQVHSIKYGYSNRCFYFLYACGIVSFLAVLISSILRLIPEWEYTEYSCATIGFQTEIRILVPIFAVCYVAWDMTVFILYIFKITQFYRKKAMDMPQIVIDRVKFILQKIVFLTVIMEISAICVAVTSDIWNEPLLTHIGVIMGILDALITTVALYLMCDRNQQDYLNLVKCLQRLGCLYCCKGFAEIALNMEEYEHQQATLYGNTAKCILNNNKMKGNRDIELTDYDINPNEPSTPNRMDIDHELSIKSII